MTNPRLKVSDLSGYENGAGISWMPKTTYRSEGQWCFSLGLPDNESAHGFGQTPQAAMNDAIKQAKDLETRRARKIAELKNQLARLEGVA